MSENPEENENPLGCEKISKLLRGFAIPSVAATLVGSLYNIVDQIFIGQGVGYLGNAATNVSYPSLRSAWPYRFCWGLGVLPAFLCVWERSSRRRLPRSRETAL